VVLDDSAPGVPAGAWEVHVPASDSSRAEELISEARLPDSELVEVDDRPDLDVETVFRARSGPSAEMEALAVKGMLEAAGIGAIFVGDSVLPNLPFEVQVAKENVARANEIIAQAQSIGAEAAEEEERATETPLNP
jgi:hypothetical protein